MKPLLRWHLFINYFQPSRKKHYQSSLIFEPVSYSFYYANESDIWVLILSQHKNRRINLVGAVGGRNIPQRNLTARTMHLIIIMFVSLPSRKVGPLIRKDRLPSPGPCSILLERPNSWYLMDEHCVSVHSPSATISSTDLPCPGYSHRTIENQRKQLFRRRKSEKSFCLQTHILDVTVILEGPVNSLCPCGLVRFLSMIYKVYHRSKKTQSVAVRNPPNFLPHLMVTVSTA